MFRTWMALTVLVFSFSTLANVQTLDGFHQRFHLQRDMNGVLTAVKMKFTSKFSLGPYITQIKNDLIKEIQRLRKQNKAVIDDEINTLLEMMLENSDKSLDAQLSADVFRDAMLNLPSVDVEFAFSEASKHGVLRNFELELKKALKMLDLSIIADPTDSKFFYRKNVTYTVVRQALEFAKRKFDNIPVLNLVSFIIVKVHDLVLEQRAFHQNMLLHYLENVKESDLGMSKKEVDLVFSSIFESRIPVAGYFESQEASATWTKYGLNKFYSIVRSGNNKIRRSLNSTMSMDNKINWAFVMARNEKGEKVIYNLVNNQNMFSSEMAEAYNYDSPNKIERTRALLNIGQLGLGFLPISGWVKSIVTGFIESFYVDQKLTEGALAAYFEANSNEKMFRAIMKQNINPYLYIY